MGFLLNLKDQGILDDEKVMECLEALPLYQTAAEKTAFFQQEMFDTKKVEDELYKPMVADYKKQKKENKQVKEKKPRVKKVVLEGEETKPKEKKPRVKKVVVEGEEETKPKEKKPRAKKVVVEGEPKRGRKPKQQIVEFAQEEEVPFPVEEEGLDMLIQSMNQKKEETVSSDLDPVSELEDINIEDVENMLQELEAEDIKEPEPVKVSTPILKEKKKKAEVIVQEEKNNNNKPVSVKKGKKNSVKIVDNK